MQRATVDWQPLQQAGTWVPEFTAWRPLLESPGAQDAIFQDAASAAGDPYYTLVSATLLPRIQSAISTAWQVREWLCTLQI